MRSLLLLAALLLVPGTLAGAGSAVAQAPEGALTPLGTVVQVVLAPLPGPIPPGETVTVLGEVEYTIAQASPGPVLPDTRITLRVTEAPGWAEVALEPEALTIQPGRVVDAGPVTLTERFQARIRIVGEPLAFTPETLRIEAEAEPNPPYAGASGDDAVPILVGYWPLVKAVADPDRVALDEKGRGAFTLVTANYGNAVSRIRVELLKAPGVDVTPERASFVLESAHEGPDARRETRVNVRATDAFEAPGEVVLGVWAEYVFDATIRGPTVRVPVTLERDGAVGIRGLTWHDADSGVHPSVPLGALGAMVGLVLRHAYGSRTRPGGPRP